MRGLKRLDLNRRGVMPANGSQGYGHIFPKRMQPPAGAPPRAPPNWNVGGMCLSVPHGSGGTALHAL